MGRITPPDYEVMFSVEVTTYNQEKYIAQALDSILTQEHNYKYEILVSDDCSTDNTPNIIKEYAARFPDIIKPVYNERNIGGMANYYATVSRAKGKYLMDCAGDDCWLPGKVEKQIKFMENNINFDICYGYAKAINENNELVNNTFGDHYGDYKDIFFIGNNVPSLTMCIRKSFFDEYLSIIEPDQKNWNMEDLPFLLYTVFENRNIYFFNEVIASYRILPESLSHSRSLEKAFLFAKGSYTIRRFFADRYGISYPKFDCEKELLNKYNEKKKVTDNKKKLKNELKEVCMKYNIKLSLNLLFYIKRFLKYCLPYGLIVLLRRNRCKN